MKRAALWLCALTLFGCAEKDSYQPLSIKPVFDRETLVVQEGETIDLPVRLSQPVFAAYTMGVEVTNVTSGLDRTAITVEPRQLSFGSGQQVATLRITAPVDTNGENEEAMIRIGAGFAFAQLPVRVIDQEAVNIKIEPSTERTEFEEGESLSYTISLTKQPSSAVQVAVGIPIEDPPFFVNDGHFTVEPGEWTQPHVVTLRGREDNNLTTDRVVVEFRLNSELYAQKALTVSDISVQRWLAAPDSVLVPEGRDLSIAVQLTQKPTDPVTLNAVSADPDRLVVSPTPLVFTGANYNKPQRLEFSAKPDDDVVNNIVNLNLSGGGAELVVPVEIVDPDRVQIQATPATLSVAEGDGGNFTVQLSKQPSAPITVTVAPENSQAATVSSGGTLSFTRDTWNQPQTVSFSSSPDFYNVDTEVKFLLKGQGAATGVFTLNLQNSDTNGVVVSPSALEIWESGDGHTGTIGVRMSSGSASVTVSSSDDSKMQVTSNTNITVNGTEQDITVTGVSDADAGDDTVYLLLESDGRYAGVPVTVRDRTQQGFEVQTDRCLHVDVPNNGQQDNRDPGPTDRFTDCVIIQEEGPAGVMKVRLQHDIGENTATVNISPAAGHETQLYAEPRQLTFTGADWDQPQEVRLFAVGDPDTNHPDIFNVVLQDDRTPQATATRPVVIQDEDQRVPGAGDWMPPRHAGTGNPYPDGQGDHPMGMPANGVVRKTMAWNAPYLAFLVTDDRSENNMHLIFTTRNRDWASWGSDTTARQWALFGNKPQADHPNSATVLPIRRSEFAVLANVHDNTHYREFRRPADTGQNVEFHHIQNTDRNFGDSIGNAMARAVEVTGMAFVRPNGDVEFLRVRNTDVRQDVGSVERVAGGATWVSLEYMGHNDRFMLLYGDAAGQMHCALRASDGSTVGSVVDFELPTVGLATTYDWVRRRVAAVYSHNDTDADLHRRLYGLAISDDCTVGKPLWIKKTSSEVEADEMSYDPPQISFNGVEYGVATNTRPPEAAGEPGFGARIVRVNPRFGSKDEFFLGTHAARYPAVAWAGDRWFMQYPVNHDPANGTIRLALNSYKITDRDGQLNGTEDGVDCIGTYCTNQVRQASASWRDMSGDDLTAGAIDTFFRLTARATRSTSQDGLGTHADDWMFVSVTGGGAVCLKNAGWYTEQLKTYGVSTRTVLEPYPWEHYYRPEGGGWTSASTTPLENLFGEACAGMFSWCLPSVQGGAKLTLSPANTGADECAVDGNSPGEQRTIAIQLGPNAAVACGIE